MRGREYICLAVWFYLLTQSLLEVQEVKSGDAAQSRQSASTPLFLLGSGKKDGSCGCRQLQTHESPAVPLLPIPTEQFARKSFPESLREPTDARDPNRDVGIGTAERNGRGCIMYREKFTA